MQDDITWGVKHLVAQGIADPKRVAILGGSYGGYATLAGVAFTPDVYAAAVSIVGPSNLMTLLDSIPPYWEAGRKMFHMRMGDPTTPEGKKQLERQSPLNSADEDQDAAARRPGGQRSARQEGGVGSDRRRAARPQVPGRVHRRARRGARLRASRQQHGDVRRRSRSSCGSTSARATRNACRADVSARLKEITVDPTTVKLAKPVDATAVTMPAPSQPLETAPATYAVTIALGAQSMKMESTNTVTDAGGTLTVTETMKTPQGEAIGRVRDRQGHARGQDARDQAGPDVADAGVRRRQGHRYGGDGRSGAADRGWTPAVRSSPTAPPRSARSRRCRSRTATPSRSATST